MHTFEAAALSYARLLMNKCVICPGIDPLRVLVCFDLQKCLYTKPNHHESIYISPLFAVTQK